MKQLCLILACCISTLAFSQAHWEITSLSPMPERVTNNAVVEGYSNGQPYVYSFAGLDSTKEYSGIHLRSFRYSILENSWETLPELPDTLGKIAAAASRIGDIIYIIGGYHVFSDGSELSSDRVHRFDTQTNAFLTDGSPIPIAIDDQVQAVWRDSLIYVVTGWSDFQNVVNVQIYNPATDEWQAGTSVFSGNTYPAFGAAGTIVGDTIFYYGGARNSDFGIQRHIRKGVINPDNPTEINWSAFILDGNLRDYRAAATNVSGNIYWVGGSNQTYNYNGIAYSNGQGVNPNNQSLYYQPGNGYYEVDNSQDLPMDLRGIATFGDTIRYLAGGMLADQTVTNQLIKLEVLGLPVSTEALSTVQLALQVSPNPVSEELTVDLPARSQVRLFDRSGQLLREVFVATSQWQLPVADLPVGTYFLEVVHEGQRLSASFVKQ